METDCRWTERRHSPLETTDYSPCVVPSTWWRSSPTEWWPLQETAQVYFMQQLGWFYSKLCLIGYLSWIKPPQHYHTTLPHHTTTTSLQTNHTGNRWHHIIPCHTIPHKLYHTTMTNHTTSSHTTLSHITTPHQTAPQWPHHITSHRTTPTMQSNATPHTNE